MSKLLEAFEKRIELVNTMEEPADENNKVFSVRLPIELIEKIDSLGFMLHMNKTEVARFLLSNSIDEIYESFKIKTERHGISFEDQYALETGEKTLEEVIGKYQKKDGEK